MDGYTSFLRPLLFCLDAETAHRLAHRVMATGFPWGLMGDRLFVRDDRLHVNVAGLKLANPVGIAPGLDKNGLATRSLQQFGFGYVFVGSILPEPRTGNPRPRVRRLVEQESMINCYGLPSDGLEVCAARLRKVRPRTTKVFANFDALTLRDYLRSYEVLQPLVDAVELSTRCPNNVDDDGEFYEPMHFEHLLREITRRKRKPLFLKMVPWENEKEKQNRLDLVERALHYGVDGFTIPGTWNQADPKLSLGRGHISGRMAFTKTLDVVQSMYAVVGNRAIIKALGGISNGQEAFAAIAAGATLVELLTAFIYQGWTTAFRINRELAERMSADGWTSIEALRGAGARMRPAELADQV